MKKIIIPLIILGAVVMTGCDSKSCRCYELVGAHWTGPNTSYVASGTRCSDLNNSTRKCNEMDDPIIDPDDIGVDTKKK